MIRFHQTFGAHAGRTVTFEKDVITIGRLPTCDISFDARADIDASGQHAEVRRENGVWHVVDANSRNGTWLNGQRVTRAQLSTGDELELGRGGPRLRVDIVQPAMSAPHAPARVEVGLLPTAQWTADDFPPTAVPMSRPPGGPGSVHPPRNYPQSHPQTARPPAPRAPVPGPALPTPVPRQRAERSAQRRGPGLAVGIAAGAIALVFAALAVGVLAWRLRASTTAHAPPRPKLPPGAAAEIIAATAGPATYLVAAHLPNGSVRAVCTAFAVRPDVVATTGRCVTQIKGLRDGGVVVDLVRPGLGAPIGIAAMYLHPAFNPGASGISDDVGVIRTAGPLAAVLALPTLDDLRAVTAGSAAYVYAYVGPPGADPAPTPVVVAGVFGTATHFDGSSSEFDGAQMLPHTAAVEPSGMGAPVLDDTGLLVALHASETKTERSFAVRADVLVALITGLGT